MAVSVLSNPPNLNNFVQIQKDSALLVAPPLENHRGPLFGDIYICQDKVCFYSEASSLGIAVPYSDINIHMASRQEGQPNIYFQLTSGTFFPGQLYPKDDPDVVTELRLIPRDNSTVEGLYMTILDCMTMYSDVEKEEFSVDQSDTNELNELQAAAFKHLETVFEPKQ